MFVTQPQPVVFMIRLGRGRLPPEQRRSRPDHYPRPELAGGGTGDATHAFWRDWSLDPRRL